MHPGHPLVGRSLPVVRRYRERGERLWIIELPDGSRQYVPASWCTPLATPTGRPAPAGPPPAEVGPAAPPPWPLSVTGLRALAELVAARLTLVVLAARKADHGRRRRQPDGYALPVALE